MMPLYRRGTRGPSGPLLALAYLALFTLAIVSPPLQAWAAHTVVGEARQLSGALSLERAGLFLLFPPARRSPQAPGLGPRVVAAQVRWQGASGADTVSCGFPLPPGYLTEAELAANQVRVFVAGVEEPIYVEALRGRHWDGTMRTIRSLLIQFPRTFSTTPASAEVWLGSARTIGTLSKTAVSDAFLWGSTTGATLTYQPGVLVPTDAAYLCATRITFQDLMTDAALAAADSESYAYFTTYAEDRLTALASTGAGAYQRGAPATYEYPRTLWSRWCMGGSITRYWEGCASIRWEADRFLGPGADTGYSPVMDIEGITTARTTNGLGGGVPNEAHSVLALSFATGYLLTGWGTYHAIVNALSQRRYINAQATALSPTAGYMHNLYGPRFNFGYNGNALFAIAVSNLVDATVPVTTPSRGPTTVNFPSHLGYVIDAIVNSAYTLGDFRDGMVGRRQTTTDFSGTGPTEGAVAGDHPTFQMALATDFLLFYQREVHHDARIHALIKTNMDVVLNHAVALTTGESQYSQGARWGYTYMLGGVAGRDAGKAGSDFNTAASYTVVMFLNALAYLSRAYPAAVVNGKTYAQWYTEFVKTANVIHTGTNPLVWSWKIVGESFGNNMAAPYYRNVANPSGPASIQASTAYAAFPPVL